MKLKKFFYVRQSAVITDSADESLLWREEKLCLKALESYEVELLFSSFDHYSKSQRKAVKTSKNYKLKSFFTPGYKRHTGFLRVLDSFLFSMQTAYYLYKNANKGDVVVYAIPTTAPIFISRLLLVKGVRVVFDFRDAWPDAVLDRNNILYPIFYGYLKVLFSVSGANNIESVAMSDTLADYYSKTFSLVRKRISTIVARRGEFKFDEYYAHCILDKYLENRLNTEYIFFAGSLVKLFDWDLCFNLFSTVRRDVQVLIAGDGPLVNQLISRFEVFDNITFLGRIPSKHVRILSNYSCFNFCFYQGDQFKGHLTNKILEYAESSRPFIHNLGPFYLNGVSYNLGLEYDYSLGFDQVVDNLNKNDCSLVKRQFLKECDRSILKGIFDDSAR